jgi:hypothetical protein
MLGACPRQADSDCRRRWKKRDLFVEEKIDFVSTFGQLQVLGKIPAYFNGNAFRFSPTQKH